MTTESPQRTDTLVHLRRDGVGVVLATEHGALPRVLHWGTDLGSADDVRLRDLLAAVTPPSVRDPVDAGARCGLLAENSRGWSGTPGLTGHRDGVAFSPRFELTDARVAEHAVTWRAHDPAAGLDLRLELELLTGGLLRTRAAVTNVGDGVYTVDALTPLLPVPPSAAELLDHNGRWSRERHPQRRPFGQGTWLRESRRGRTGFDGSLLVAGDPGFGYRHGEVWAVHVAWSGHHRTLAERTSQGHAVLGGGELLLPGEVRLDPGAEYASPWLYGSYGATGLDEVAGRFHRWLRSRPEHPTSPRPVVVNTWEAVYFDHSLPRLTALADAAAAVGGERFVLDDGWFRHRRDDTAGLGDWYVDEGVWPEGLWPLIRHVQGLGMRFGLWVEPEMINEDSDLARAHPDWIMGPGHGRNPLPSRHQQVLDLANPDAYGYLLGRLDALLTEYPIEYLKWDHNRDLVEAGHPTSGRAGVHEQTVAVYRLFAELRARHPDVEIESCSSGGGRVDLEVVRYTQRVWASDNIDAHERQEIQRGTSLLLPLELIGVHVGSPTAHTTQRRLDLDFRAATALFGHFGVEWNLTDATDRERARLTEWIGLYRELRPLLHTGTLVHGDRPDPAITVHGVVSPDGADAVYVVACVATPVVAPPGPVRLPGLDPDADYRVTPQPPGDRPAGRAASEPAWWTRAAAGDAPVLSGRVLDRIGLQLPELLPDTALVLRARRATDVVRPG